MNQMPTQRRAVSDEPSATRDALRVAARQVIGAHGLAGASSRRIADAAGTNLASITYWFGSKDALVADALFGGLSDRLAPMMALLESDAPAVERLAGAVASLVAEFERARDEVPIHLHALVLAADGDVAGAPGRDLVADLRARVAVVVAALVREGAIEPWIDPEAMAGLIVATANGLALQSRLDPTGPSVAALAAQFASLLLAVHAPAPPEV